MKKLTVALISLATLGLGIAVPLQAKAEPFHFEHSGFSINLGHRFQRQYDVYYRDDRYDDEWRFAGSYRSWKDANYAARKLERRGYIAQIEPRFHSRW
ncbi:hypothetical protein [Altericista sp. CCNU0014]|uniref:hypothetical protein n=1 Tax=Altericista sp. CCNU0014 TaxID=3082949 RepID=UPI00384D573A